MWGRQTCERVARAGPACAVLPTNYPVPPPLHTRNRNTHPRVSCTPAAYAPTTFSPPLLDRADSPSFDGP